VRLIKTNSLEALDWKWYSGVSSIGVVLCKNSIGQTCCYIGVALAGQEDMDIQHIMDFGSKVEKSVAEAMFNRTLENYKW
jgi:hypothetical protein